MQQRLIFEDLNDALREVVQVLGGAKAVGPMLWPEKSVEAAHQLLLACLNAERKERLNPDQVLLLLRKGRDADCHAAMTYVAQECGYEVQPVEPADQQAQLVREFITAAERLSKIQEQITANGGIAALRAVKA